MMKPLRMWVVAALSLVVTYLFFYEYLPPFRQVHLPYDLHDYHYPLADYAFQALRAGRLPEWDFGIYCGIPFVANIQAALFYPPSWLLFASKPASPALSYAALQDFVFLHVWVAFLLCYAWLCQKGLTGLACTLGAAIFAFSGHMCLQLQHLGLVAGYTWMPLGLWGIDQAVEERRWQPLWKVTAASALCLLGGYVPTWFTFSVCMAAYAAWRWRVLLGTVAALAASLLVCAVQLLPTLEATAMKTPELNYGTGVKDPRYLAFYLMPNFPDMAMQSQGRRDDQYLYLGGVALVGLISLAWAGRWRSLVPLAAMAGAVLVFLTNPLGLVWEAIRHSKLLSQVCRDWYFLAGVTLAVAPLAAIGLDGALRRKARPAARWLAPATLVLLAAWAARLIVMRNQGKLAIGWNSAIDAGLSLALCALAVYLLPAQKGRMRVALAAALLLTIGVEYKVFGTSRRFNAGEGTGAYDYGSGEFPAMDPAVYMQIRDHADYRIAVDLTAPYPQNLRHVALATPQGFDPFLTRQYVEALGSAAKFRTNREFDLDPANEEVLRLLGVRYFISSEAGPQYRNLLANPRYRLLEPSRHFYKVFELADSRPPYGWVSPAGGASVRLVGRTPEERSFVVRSEAGGQFALIEQLFPGWKATVDGAPVAISRWRGAFQAVQVPGGEHRVEFRYRSPGLRIGAWVSLATLLIGAGLLWRRRKVRRGESPQPS